MLWTAIVDDLEVTELRDLGREVHRCVVAGLMYALVPLPTESHEVVVLGDHLAAGTGEVEREGRHVAAEIVHFEDQILGKLGCVAPHDPPDPQWGQTELVA